MRLRLNRGQWTVVGLLLGAIALELAFSPYWHAFYKEALTKNDGNRQMIYVTNEGFMVVAFLLFGLALITMLAGISPKAGYAIAGLLLLSVVLARAQPIIDWMDATTGYLKEASGS